jgi:hypothetical protein
MNEPADDAAITALRRTLTVGREADIAFSIAPRRRCWRSRNRNWSPPAQTLAVLAALGDDRAVRATDVAGRMLGAR